MKAGWIKLHREWQLNSTIMRDSEHLAVWIWLLWGATIDRQEACHSGFESIRF